MHPMSFTDDEFLNLIDEVERQGGVHLSGLRCDPHKYALKVPNAKGELRFQDFFTSGCSRESLFELDPVVMAGDDDPFHKDAPVIVCAMDDGLKHWPRFAEAVAVER